MQDAAFVKEPLKRYCMCFGSVGLHRICGLVVKSYFKNLVLSKMILRSWYLVLCQSCRWRNWIYFGLFVDRFGYSGTQSCTGVPSNIHHDLTNMIQII